MADPLITGAGTQVATGLTGAIMLLLGPKFGPLLAPLIGDYLLILCGAVAGVMHPVSMQMFASRWGAVGYMLRWVATAAVLTGLAAAALETWLKVPATSWPGAVAFGITFLADKWRGLVDYGVEWVKARFPKGAA